VILALSHRYQGINYNSSKEGRTAYTIHVSICGEEERSSGDRLTILWFWKEGEFFISRKLSISAGQLFSMWGRVTCKAVEPQQRL